MGQWGLRVEDPDGSGVELCSSDEKFADKELCGSDGEYSSDEEWLWWRHVGRFRRGDLT